MGQPGIGITRDDRLKREDSNALHAAFARNQLEAGPGTTRAQDAYANPGNGRVTFFAHHSPGCGQVRAGPSKWSGVTDREFFAGSRLS